MADDEIDVHVVHGEEGEGPRELRITTPVSLNALLREIGDRWSDDEQENVTLTTDDDIVVLARE